jgi:hypothetical protein
MTRSPRSPRVKIVLTEELIEDSKQRDSSHCMIAEAVKVAHPGASHVSVDLQTIRFTDQAKGLRYTYLTPRAAQVALINFDAGVTPEPLDFMLRGGQVTKSGTRPRALQPQSEAQLEQRRAAAAKGVESKQKLVQRHGAGDDNGGNVSEVVGGKTPPLGKIKGKTRGERAVAFTKRRAFGLRGLDR